MESWNEAIEKCLFTVAFENEDDFIETFHQIKLNECRIHNNVKTINQMRTKFQQQLMMQSTYLQPIQIQYLQQQHFQQIQPYHSFVVHFY